MKSQRRIVFGILLTALLALSLGALADSPLGIRSGAPYGSISLSSGTDAATVLDWLEDYLQSEITPNVMLASDLANYSEKVEQNRAMLNSANDDDVTKWLHDYDGVPNGGTLTARQLAVRSQRELLEAQSELAFYADRLDRCLTEDDYIRRQIKSGDYTPGEIEQLRIELNALDAEAEKYRVSALKKLMGNDALTETASRARSQLSIFDASNPYRAAVASIQGLGAYVERRQINALTRQENGEGIPHITVISEKQVSVWIKDPIRTGEMGNPLGVQGIAVTLQAEKSPGVLDKNKKQTLITDEDGLVVFETANFNENEDRVIQVHVSIEDVREREDTSTTYQRKYYGRIEMKGGDDPFTVIAAVDDGSPYLVSLLFEDLDMLVSDDGMYISKNNTTEFNVHGEVEMNGFRSAVHVKATDIGPAAFGDKASGDVLFDEVIQPGSDGTFSVKSQWLNRSASSGTPAFR